MFPETIATESLELRQLSVRYVDAFDLYDLFAADRGGETVLRYVPVEPFHSLEDARDWLSDAESEWNDAESAKYAVVAPDDSLAGVAAASLDWDRRAASLAVMLDQPYWGQGYAGECATALADLAFERLDLDLVSMSYDGDNERSRRAIESFVDRHGGRKDGRLRNWTLLGDEVVDNHRYTVSRDEYRSADS